MKYKVYFTRSYNVEADSPDEAKEKANRSFTESMMGGMYTRWRGLFVCESEIKSGQVEPKNECKHGVMFKARGATIRCNGCNLNGAVMSTCHYDWK